MAHQTEAACLLESGAQYPTRVLLKGEPGDPIFAGFKPGGFSLFFGDAPIYHFDLEGRWQRAFVEGIHYLKGLDATVQAIDRVREGANLVLKRRTLDPSEAGSLDARVASTALEVLGSLDQGRVARVDPSSKGRPLDPEALRAFLTTVAGWDRDAWRSFGERYRATYGPWPFLPPDCLNALVLQATLGHAGGVAFGRGRAAQPVVRTPEEFEAHARGVAGLLGRRIAQCRGIFLGGSDVLRRPPHEIAAFLETIARVFPVDPEAVRRRPLEASEGPRRLDGVHAFLDDFRPPRPDAEAWRAFRRQGLRRVTLGVESGDPPVRSLYRKGWEDRDLVETVSDLKAADIGVGVVVLVDAGGEENAEAHLGATAGLIESLPLAAGDLVSLLDGEEVRDHRDGDPGFTPLAAARRADQQARLKQRLAALRSARGARVVAYSLEKQVGG